MTHRARTSFLLTLATLVAACAPPADSPKNDPSPRADRIAGEARAAYGDAMLATLADLVAFETVHQEGLANAQNPEFQAMTSYLKEKAAELGLGFEDHGAVVVLTLGDAEDRLGLVTHGDVQPADPAKWARDPFRLDAESEPGRLVGRGVEDDKGPIAAALYAMKALKDQDLALDRRVELIVSYTEESDWQPFIAFLGEHPPPDLNVALDAEYPLVTAEKGFGAIYLGLPPDAAEPTGDGPRLVSFTGGVFLAQVPEDARATVAGATPELEATLVAAAEGIDGVGFTFTPQNDGLLLVAAHGLAAHSSKPWEGKNAITHLALLLGEVEWPESAAARMVRLVNDLVGTGDFAERFGELAYEHPFMGQLTLALTTLGEVETDDGLRLEAAINIRRPAGLSNEEVDRRIHQAVDAWRETSGVTDVRVETMVYDPYLVEDAPHVPVLLDVYRRHTGQADAAPISIGGGTHARLVPGGVNFGPAMPGEPYTGHSEHEYMDHGQLLENLEMLTAALVELAAAP